MGGTFTDLILMDDVTGAVRLPKVLTTLDNQAFGVLRALADTGVALAEVDSIVHGTTTTINAILEQLGVMPSFSRPAVSNDNPFSEALFKTLKYQSSYPRRPFRDLAAARTWVNTLAN